MANLFKQKIPAAPKPTPQPVIDDEAQRKSAAEAAAAALTKGANPYTNTQPGTALSPGTGQLGSTGPAAPTAPRTILRS